VQGEKLVDIDIDIYWQTARKMVTHIHRRKRENRTQSGSIIMNREITLLMPLLLTCCSVKVKRFINIFLQLY
jgi:hypothetical protein